MKLGARMTVALGAAAASLFSAGGFALVSKEERELYSVTRNEALLLARALQVAIDNALRDKQIEDVKEIIDSLEAVDPRVNISVYDEKDRLVYASDGAQPTREALSVQSRAKQSSVPIAELTAGSPGVLRVGIALREETPSRSSCIVLERSLGELERDLATTRIAIWLTVAGFIAVVTAMTWLLTRRYVGAPLQRMIEDMRHVRSGQSLSPRAPRGADEVGQAQQEFDALAADLDAARVRAEHELEARRKMERGLQHADKLITLGQLSAVMAHEVGSPLQILEGRARALRKHADDAEATRRTSDVLVEQTQRIARIVNEMLSITRRRSSARTLCDPEAPVRAVASLLETEAKRRDVRLSVETEGRCEVLADPDQVQQVALNLIRNALDAAPPKSAVQVRCGAAGAGFTLEVRDEGAGISPDIRPQLFEPFVTTKAAAGGTGLGLSVVRSIVQDHGGTVEVVAGPPGCTIRVTLPRADRVAS